MGSIPVSVSDVLLHNKTSDRTEEVIMPITRYENVLNAPKLITDVSAVNGSPFTLLATGKESISTAKLRKLVPGIL